MDLSGSGELSSQYIDSRLGRSFNVRELGSSTELDWSQALPQSCLSAVSLEKASFEDLASNNHKSGKAAV